MAKLTKKQVVKHQRGFFGRVWQIIFWGFQALMIYSVFINVSAVGEVGSECSGEEFSAACQAGVAIGGGIIATLGWFVWFLGTVILGIFMFATRGKQVVYDVD